MLWRRGKSYSQDLRERVFAAADDGERVGQIATQLRVSVAYVSKALSRRRLTGQTTARPQRCHVAAKLSGLHPAILSQVTSRPDATIAELRAWLLGTHKVSASTGLMNKTLAALDLTFKKSPSTPPSKCARTLPRHPPNGARSSQADPVKACFY
jgi:transposase